MTLTQIKPAGLSKPVDLADNEQIRLGTGNDLLIFHDGTNSSVQNGTGTLRLRGDSIKLNNNAASENYLVATANGSVELYYDNSKKFETTSYGALVSGELQATGANFTDDGQSSPIVSVLADDGNPWGIAVGNSAYSDNAQHGWQVFVDSSGRAFTYNIGSSTYNDWNWYLSNSSASKQMMKFVASTLSVQLYYDNSEKLRTTSSGIRITSDLGIANVGGTLAGSGGTENWMGIKDTSGNFVLSAMTAGTNVGRVGIGTTAPEVMLDIRSSDPGIQLVDTDGTSTYANIDYAGDTLIFTSRGGSSSNGIIDFRRYNGSAINTSMRIDSSGRVGIGTTNPSQFNSAADDLVIQGSGSCGITIDATSSTNSNIFFADGATGNEAHRGYTQYQHSNDILVLGRGGVDHLMLQNDGGTKNVLGNFIVGTAGRGLQFNANDSGSSEVLDDYEEGNYTPTDSSGAGLTLVNNTTARYTKIGRMVYVQYDITWPSTSSGSAAGFSLPFALSLSYGSGPIGWTDNGNPLFIHVGGYAYVMDNSSSIGNSSQHTLNSEISGKRLIGNFWYIA